MNETPRHGDTDMTEQTETEQADTPTIPSEQAKAEADDGDAPLIFPVRLLQVVKAADKDTGRATDNVVVEQRGHKVRTVATNGFCLVAAEANVELFPAERQLQLSAGLVGGAIQSNLKGDIDILQEADGVHVSARLTNGLQIKAAEPMARYPSVDSLLNPALKGRVTAEVSLKHLTTLLKTMAACIEHPDKVTLHIAQGNLLHITCDDDVTTVRGVVCGEIIENCQPADPEPQAGPAPEAAE